MSSCFDASDCSSWKVGLWYNTEQEPPLSQVIDKLWWVLSMLMIQCSVSFLNQTSDTSFLHLELLHHQQDLYRSSLVWHRRIIGSNCRTLSIEHVRLRWESCLLLEGHRETLDKPSSTLVPLGMIPHAVLLPTWHTSACVTTTSNFFCVIFGAGSIFLGIVPARSSLAAWYPELHAYFFLPLRLKTLFSRLQILWTGSLFLFPAATRLFASLNAALNLPS